jgi:hypothetical protein
MRRPPELSTSARTDFLRLGRGEGGRAAAQEEAPRVLAAQRFELARDLRARRRDSAVALVLVAHVGERFRVVAMQQPHGDADRPR